MVSNIVQHQVHTYQVNTPVYEGPLDLLLQLIERAELDITKLALAQVTDQYLDYLHELEEKNPDEVSAFLVIASRLLQIKSELLLPRPPLREAGEEDPGEMLAQQLIIYKCFKELALALAKREAAGYRTYLRVAPSTRIEHSLHDMGDITLQDLFGIVQLIFAGDTRSELTSIVAAPKVTLRDKINQITRYLNTYQQGTFIQLLSKDPHRLDIVVTFLAILELVKRTMIYTYQPQLFGDIEIKTSEEWNAAISFELEFGE